MEAPLRRSELDRLAVFAVMWALAHAWHVLGNPGLAPAWSQAMLGVAVVAVLLHPGAVVPLGAMALAALVTVWLEAPMLGNHWLLVGFVDLLILLAIAVGAVRRRPWDRLDLAARVVPGARLCLLGFYAFAAVAKLNSSFLDPTVSCAVFYFREATDSVGLGGLVGGGAGWLDRSVIVATIAIELSVPVLLVWRRTRHVGVVVGLAFHLVVAVDRTHQFFDFSSVLAALFVLFLPAGFATWASERGGSLRARAALRSEHLARFLPVGVAALVGAAVLVVVVARIDQRQGIALGWAPFLLYGTGVLWLVLRYLVQVRPVATDRLAPHHPLFLVVPLLVVGNGLTPYLELKTGYGWQMYANLRTVDGDSNHLLVRRTLPLTDEHADVVEILETDDPGLDHYRRLGYGLTWRQLRTYAADRPEISLIYVRGGETVALERAADQPELVDPVPSWREKVQLFRAVDLEGPPERCVPAFGPAR